MNILEEKNDNFNENLFFKAFGHSKRWHLKPKRERGYYVVIHAVDSKTKKLSTTNLEPFTYFLPEKRTTKKYKIPHVWPEKYKEWSKNQDIPKEKKT